MIQFLSYEGSFTAVGGPADGLTITDIGVAETSSTPVGQLLQLIDGVWIGPASENTFWFSPDRDGLVGNAEDIVRFDGSGYSTVFDGSALGLSRSKIDAFDILDDTMILMSFDRPVTLAGLGRVDDSDVVKFKVASLGEGSTAGSFELFLDGSELGLTRGGEDIDALTGSSDGSIMIHSRVRHPSILMGVMLI